MPLYEEHRMEHNINSGHITIVGDEGRHIPAYWSHPNLGKKFSGIVLLHDWWGVTPMIRRLSNFFAQMGYYVIVPDLFDGKGAASPQEALKLVEEYQPESYKLVDAALSVLESHHMCNRDVAAIGIGMGGSLTYEAAIKRTDLEAAISFGGFPQSYLGQFHQANTPILALYGENEPYTKPPTIQALRQELAKTPLKDKHQVQVINGLAHDFFLESFNETQQGQSRDALQVALTFLEAHLQKPEIPGEVV